MHTSLIELLKHALLDLKASWVMWILLGLSVLNLIIVVERIAFLRSVRDDIPRLARELDALLRLGKVREALERMKASRSAEAAVVVAGLRHADLGPVSAERAMVGATALERVRLERGLAVLGTVGNNAPFLGLLGTVIGVIEAFDILGRPLDTGALAQAASALAPQTIMSSIAEALVATAVGLFVAIPAVAAYNYFQRRIQGVGANTEALTNVLLAHLAAEPPLDASAPPLPQLSQEGAR
ncbi:MAG TPA: MotA/TolQ/ExbB proton channel family protein [Anaeromyxobacteraceae bacterium]|nr:MotA/TolQ/ExbB proton channel family protein [Anaeromyxobacteraceae bacterium]